MGRVMSQWLDGFKKVFMRCLFFSMNFIFTFGSLDSSLYLLKKCLIKLCNFFQKKGALEIRHTVRYKRMLEVKNERENFELN